jgi:hypothetical protein
LTFCSFLFVHLFVQLWILNSYEKIKTMLTHSFDPSLDTNNL